MVKKLKVKASVFSEILLHFQATNPAQCLKHSVSLYLTALELFSQREIPSFQMIRFQQLTDLYHTAYQTFLSLTLATFKMMEQLKLIEANFNIAMTYKLKAAEKFYRKAKNQLLQAQAHTCIPENLRKFFHNGAASLLNVIDIHVDMLRLVSVLHRHVDQGSQDNLKIAGCETLLDQRKRLENLRAVMTQANIQLSHDSYLNKFLLAIKNYLIPEKQWSLMVVDSIS